jgi:hypothetical protein
MINLSSLLKKAHLFRCARTTRSNVAKTGVLEWWSNGVMHFKTSTPILPHPNAPFLPHACARGFVARLASGTFLITLRERVFRQSVRDMLFVYCVGSMLSGCAAAVATNGDIASTENPETSFASCPYLREQQASCDELKKAYDEGFSAGKEIIAAEFRTRSELNQPYVWKPPMISEVDMPALVVNGVMIPAHRELVIVRPGQWIRAKSLLGDRQ